MALQFAITFDYLCPFARNANEHVVAGLQAGAGWDVSFTAYSLAQGNVVEGDVPVWERADPSSVSGLLALQAGLAVREREPERFLDVHRELFAARHDRGEDLRSRDVVAKALDAGGADAEAILAAIERGECLEAVRADHERNVDVHGVWGVPTFIAGGRSVFVRVLDRPEGSGQRAIERIERIVTLVTDFPELHEFKQADLPV